MGLKELGVVAVVCLVGWYAWQKVGTTKAVEQSSAIEQVEHMQLRQSCMAEFDQAKNEIDGRLQYASYYGDFRAIQAYKPLAYQLVAIEKRLQSPDCNPALERERIRVIRAMLMPRRK
jgi:hypothetical protein